MIERKLVRVRLPAKLLRAMPGTHQGRSRFIIAALKEKIQRLEAEWQPKTEHGRRLKAILEKGAAARGASLDDEGIARELRERRGGLH